MSVTLTELQRKKYTKYRCENKSVFSNRVVQDFFQDEMNIVLLVRSLDGEAGCQAHLEERFRKHFFHMRFIRFLVSTIRFCSIDHMRLTQKNDKRNPLIFDQPLSEEGESTLGELLLGHHTSSNEPIIKDPSHFQASLTNEHLFQAFSKLSKKQQLITTLCYALCYQDNEVAKMFGVSPQAVFKTRNVALKKMRLAMLERG